MDYAGSPTLTQETHFSRLLALMIRRDPDSFVQLIRRLWPELPQKLKVLARPEVSHSKQRVDLFIKLFDSDGDWYELVVETKVDSPVVVRQLKLQQEAFEAYAYLLIVLDPNRDLRGQGVEPYAVLSWQEVLEAMLDDSVLRAIVVSDLEELAAQPSTSRKVLGRLEEVCDKPFDTESPTSGGRPNALLQQDWTVAQIEGPRDKSKQLTWQLTFGRWLPEDVNDLDPTLHQEVCQSASEILEAAGFEISAQGGTGQDRFRSALRRGGVERRFLAGYADGYLGFRTVRAEDARLSELRDAVLEAFRAAAAYEPDV